MPKVTFIIDGEEKTVEFEHGKLPYSNHGKPESFLDVSKHFDVGLEHACGGLRLHHLPRHHPQGRAEPERDAGRRSRPPRHGVGLTVDRVSAARRHQGRRGCES
jgi:hypothetical protein